MSIDVAEFAIDSVPVTNQEFFEFVLAGGYEQARFWQPSDWIWGRDGGIGYPPFWLKQDGEWVYRTVFYLLPLHQVGSCPVYAHLPQTPAFSICPPPRFSTQPQLHTPP